MNVRRLFGLAGGCALIAAATAHGAYTGISAEHYHTVINGNPRTVWRVYANFSSPTEGLSSIGPIGTAMTIQTYLPNGQLGSFFAGSSPTPPTQEEIDNNPNVAHRSFYTVGLSIQDQNPNPQMFPLLNVGMPAITGNTVTAAQDSAATTTTPDAPFALAGWSGQNRVLILQLQVIFGSCIRGTIGINTIGASGEAVVVVTQIGPLTCVPAPGALGLMALASVIGSRRRRSSNDRSGS